MKSAEISRKIQENIPIKFDKFPKLKHGIPYEFYKWDRDKEGRLCLYYFVTGGENVHQKRVVMNELVAVIMRFLETGRFNREDFRELCPVTSRDGDCGFTVIGRIMEYLFDAEYEGRGKGFRKKF